MKTATLSPKIGTSTFILTTTIQTMYDVRKVSEIFDNHESVLKWSIDLHDWERVLKVVSVGEMDIVDIQHALRSKGFYGEELTH